jgi:hypothetical protein
MKKYIKHKLSPWLKIDIFNARISNWKTLHRLRLYNYKFFDTTHCWRGDSFSTCALFCFRYMCECFDAFLYFFLVWTETSLFFIHVYKSTTLPLVPLIHLHTFLHFFFIKTKINLFFSKLLQLGVPRTYLWA